MRKRFFIHAAAAIWAGAAMAAAPGPDAGLLTAAEQALDARLPAVAIEKLHDFLVSSAALDDSLRERAEADLTQAMLDSGDLVGALARLEYPANDPERLWKAEALAALGRWEDAGPLFSQLASDGPAPMREAATMGRAEALRTTGREPEARALLESIEPETRSALVRLRLVELYLEEKDMWHARRLLARTVPSTPLEERWRTCVEGRLYLGEDQAAPALQDFEGLLKEPRGLSPALHMAATVGLTEAHVILNGLEVADNVLEDYIWRHPESPYLEEIFRRLDAIYAAEENPSETELQHWAQQPQARRAALACYYLGRTLLRQRRAEKALRAYTEFTQRFPRHEFVFEAWMAMGTLHLGSGRIPAAIASYEGAMRDAKDARERSRAEIATGNAYFSQGEFLLAAETFRDAAQRCADYFLQATYDSALAWLHVGNYDRFLQDYTVISERYPETEERQNLLIEEGLLQARSHDPRAGGTLEAFIRDFPESRRVAEARLALAELDYASGSLDSAGVLLKAAYAPEGIGNTREQADYLSIFLADSKPDRQDDQVIKLGMAFVETYKDSALRSQVRMKLGQVYFRREDFANAQTQFETLADEAPADPLAEKALMLAGESSVRGMSTGGIGHALALFDRVAKGAGPLKLYARQEQAQLEAREGHEKDAVIIYDDILRSGPDTPLRLASLCGKADCMVAAENAAPAASTGGTAACAAAMALYDQIAADPEVTRSWRNQALYKKARCLNKLGMDGRALAAFYDILNTPAANGAEPDFFWYEKAGYDAAAMLEAKEQWPGAISILETMARAGGPRSTEAKKRADQLRLQHFIWD